MKISNDFDKNMELLQEAAANSPDYIILERKLKDGTRFLLCYIDNMVNSNILNIELLPAIMEFSGDDFDFRRIPAAPIKEVLSLNEALAGVATGGVFFLLEGHMKGFQVRIEQWVGRMPESPDNEKSIQGSRDSFVENIRTNMAILRTKIANHNLRFEQHDLGASTNQQLMISYIHGLADEDMVERLRKRVDALNYDGFLSTSYVGQMIADQKRTPFPQWIITERTDKAQAALLEGRILILLTGSPNVLILPVSFWSFFQTIDDFTFHPLTGSLLGIFRFIGMFLSLFLPATYIAVLSYHYYIVPLNLLSTLVSSRSMVIFSPLVEAIIMEFLFEIIREASVRLPSFIGTTIGIVGGIIIGQTAVEAGIVSNLMVIVVSITAIAGFLIPNQNLAQTLRFTRYIMMLFAGFFGIAGLIISASLLFIHLLNLTSLDRPYLAPLFPLQRKNLANTIIRMPFEQLRLRPNQAKPLDQMRGKRHGKK
ncbi:MAG: spore germination protein [Bacillota bacterium]|nr:spore germination protein [Bacillota bacterium]